MRLRRLGAKLLLGMGINTDFDINSYSSASPQLKDALESMLDRNLISRDVYDEMVSTVKDTDFVTIETSPSFSGTTGLRLTYAVRSHSAIRLYVDYTFSNPKYTYKFYNRMDWDLQDEDGDGVFVEDRFEKRMSLNHFKFGMSFTSLF